jgi:SSS family solute:Na+ symporter
MAKTTSLVVKVGALLFIIVLPQEYAIYLQLLGGIWIIQTFPAIIFGLYTRWLDPKALLVGWAVGMVLGTYMGATNGFRPVYDLEIFGTTARAYIAIYSVLVNFALAFGLSAVFNASAKKRADETMPADYAAEGAAGGGMGH